jgi:RNA polymerase sigma-70 factor (ECF subfamily)
MKELLLTDEELILQYTLGNEKCLSTLFYRHQRKVITYLYFKVNDRQVAEDIFIESFFKIVTSINNRQYTESGKFYNLLISIAKNTCIDYFRKIKSQPRIINIDDTPSIRNIQNDDETAEFSRRKEIALERIKGLLWELSPVEREIVILKHFAGLTFKEISIITDTNMNTALSRMRAALQRLKLIAKVRGVEF